MPTPAQKSEKPAEALPRTVDVPITIENRGTVTFPVNLAGSGPAFVCLGVRKSGSTLLNKIVQYMARRSGVHSIDVAGTFFKNGFKVTDWLQTDLSGIVKPGNLYGGFRSYPKNLDAYPVFQNSKKVFMFRDPRDALVSQYFSDAYSHSLPSAKTEAAKQATQEFLTKRAEAQALDINSYVLERAPSMQRTLLECSHLLNDPSCLLLRYEEYIFTKSRMINKIARHFEWDIKPGQVEQLLGIVDEVPTSEDKTKFVRNVVPGDHRRKLDPETIRKLNNRIAQSLEAFDYY